MIFRYLYLINSTLIIDFKKYVEYLPIATIGVYVIGFIVTNGYLGNYLFNDSSFLTFTYLKSGILFAIFNGIIFITVRLSFSKETMTDNLEKSWVSLLAVFANSGFFCLFLTFAYTLKSTDFIIKHYNLFTLTEILMLVYFFGRMMKPSKHRALNIITLIIITIIPLVLVIIVSTVEWEIIYFAAYIYIIGQYLAITMGIFGDKQYTQRIPTDIVALILVSFLFGKFIYPKIPLQMGGNQGYKIAFKSDPLIQLSGVSKTGIDTVTVLYFNDNNFLTKDKNGKSVVINKDLIKSYVIVEPNRASKMVLPRTKETSKPLADTTKKAKKQKTGT